MPEEMARLTPEQLMFREALANTVDRVSPPTRTQKLDGEKRFDDDLHAALAELGIFGLGLDAESGGTGGTAIEQVIALEVLGTKATSMAVFAVVQYMVTRLIAENGTPEQKERYLQAIVTGAQKGAFCLTEAGGGTDILSSMRTRAVKEGGGWRINGNKMWISGAASGDILVVLARTGSDHTKGITMFLVPKETAGVSVAEMKTLAINGYDTCQLAFDDVFVDDDAVLGRVDMGFPQVMATLNGERMNAAATAIGIGRGAIFGARDYAADRMAFGRPIGKFQSVQHRLAEAGVDLEAAWLLTLEAARRDAEGLPTMIASSMAKWAASQAATRAATVGMDILASAGFDCDLPMQRYYRDVRLYSFAPLNNDMVLNLIGERWLDLPRSF